MDCLPCPWGAPHSPDLGHLLCLWFQRPRGPGGAGGLGYSLSSRSGFTLKGSRRSASGSRLLSRSSSGTVWSMPIWMRRRMADISLTFWICSAYLAYLFWRSCMKLKRVSTDKSICRGERSETHSIPWKQVPARGWWWWGAVSNRCGPRTTWGTTSVPGSGSLGDKNLPECGWNPLQGE